MWVATTQCLVYFPFNNISSSRKQILTRIISAFFFLYHQTVFFKFSLCIIISFITWILSFPSRTEVNYETWKTWPHELIKKTIEANNSGDGRQAKPLATAHLISNHFWYIVLHFMRKVQKFNHSFCMGRFNYRKFEFYFDIYEVLCSFRIVLSRKLVLMNDFLDL